ncbi:MAG TPA: glycoside hydrolase family 57 protein [Candidatus Omnitrophota bacterium]|nr:glycoside hydrolase family 57 protein [Candidatus Omnitrophota bacterium]HPT07827.1 glycoside hydrolase family 57 protein [Candidatus Omnitrophota bacterium]
MLYLAFIFHQHQPYYKNLLTNESELPWVRLHGIKDYLDMVRILEKFPKIHQTVNLVPSLLEQVQDYTQRTVKDKYLDLSYKPAAELTNAEKEFIRANFFSINKDRVIAMHPRYYELFLKREHSIEFDEQDYLDLQVWFNLAWIDPVFRQDMIELRQLVNKGRFYSEHDKQVVLAKQIDILEDIIPAYKKAIEGGQIEVTANPYYHPILPLLCNTRIAKEANIRTVLPLEQFAYPQDAQAQVDLAVKFYRQQFGVAPQGMWPSEEAVSEHILPFIMKAGIQWIVTDEGMLYKSLKSKKRDTGLLYQPHLLHRKDGDLAIIFRDRNLSDMIGFIYHRWDPKAAADDLLRHLEDTAMAFKGKDILVTIAMDGENAWEYYTNNGHDFLEYLYKRLSEVNFLKCVTVSEYLREHPPVRQIKHLAAGSWIYSEFGKWIGNPQKVRAWEYLARARAELQKIMETDRRNELKDTMDLIWKQMYICEGSDWYWWYGDGEMNFDKLFRTHLSNFYTLIGKEIPDYLKSPII